MHQMSFSWQFSFTQRCFAKHRDFCRLRDKACVLICLLKVLYSRIAVALWRSSQGIERHIAMHNTSTCTNENHGNHQASNSGAGSNRVNTKYEKRPVGTTESQVLAIIPLFTSSFVFLSRIVRYFANEIEHHTNVKA